MNTLAIFADWKAKSKAKGNANLFMPITLYESFAWLVYGIMGVASQIPEGCSMNQREGGTDDLEHEFATNRHKNPNSTIADTRGSIGQQSGFRASNFTKNLKSNTRGDKSVNIGELMQPKKRKIRTSGKYGV